MIDFKYRLFIKRDSAGNLAKIYRPIATVTLVNQGKSGTYCNMLVDSGADLTVIPKSCGDYLGFQLIPNETIYNLGGLGGEVPTVYRRLTIQIGKRSIEIRVAWALVENAPNILGREEVFDHFHIEFRQDEKITRFRVI